MSCVICCDDFSAKSTCVNCPYCDFESCQNCIQRFMIDQKVSKCMNNKCGKEWTRQDMAKKLKKTWMSNDWKKNRENVLYDREKALLPATQLVAKQREDNEKIQHEIDELSNLIKSLHVRKCNLERQLRLQDYGESSYTKKNSYFVRACPIEDCRGFLDNDWTCGLCMKKACKKCHNIIEDPSTHQCNKDDVATATLLAKDTKPCPKCNTGIFKIEGCNQMWCTQCHTAFDWVTGRLESNVHNPHYFAYMNSINQNDHNQELAYVCGETLDVNVVSVLNIQMRYLKEAAGERQTVNFIIESINHLRDVEIPHKYRTSNTENNLELRVKFLRGAIDEESFKILVQRANKAYEKKREIYQICDLLQRTVTEIVLRMIAHFRTLKPDGIENEGKPIIKKYIHEFEGIRTYVNQCLEEISQTYGSKMLIATFYESHRGNYTAYKGKTTNNHVSFTRDVLLTH